MKITRFKPNTHYEIIRTWGNKRGIDVPELELLSKTGLIVEDYCSGFLYTTNSKIAFIENVIANPDSDFYKRDKALNLLLSELEKIAQKKGFKLVLGLTKNQAMLQRVLNNEYKISDDFILVYKQIEE